MSNINKADLVCTVIRNMIFFYHVSEHTYYIKDSRGNFKKILWYNSNEKCFKGIFNGKVIKIPSLSIDDVLRVWLDNVL